MRPEELEGYEERERVIVSNALHGETIGRSVSGRWQAAPGYNCPWACGSQTIDSVLHGNQFKTSDTGENKTDMAVWIRCNSCRRYARTDLGEIMPGHRLAPGQRNP